MTRTGLLWERIKGIPEGKEGIVMFMTAILEQGVGWERTSHESLNIETV